MKPLSIILLLFIVLNTLTKAQSSNWVWARSAGGSNEEIGTSVCTDVSGNAYVTGYFNSPVFAAGSISLNNADTSGSTFDIFLMKYDPSGNLLWARSAGGPWDDLSSSIAIDGNGYIFLTGSFKSLSIAFGNFILSNAHTGSTDAFFCKYDTSGNAVWAKNYGGNGNEYGISVFSDPLGNPCLTGGFQSDSILFDTICLKNLGTGFSDDIFVAKFDSSGHIKWAASAGTISQDNGRGIAADALGNTYVTGIYGQHDITFGSFILPHSGGNSYDIFIVKYDSTGTIIWARSATGTDADITSDIVVTNNHVLITGYSDSQSLTFGSTTLTTAGQADIFVASYDLAGNVSWAKLYGGTNRDFGHGIAAVSNESTIITGRFRSSSISFGSITLTNASTQWWEDLYVAKIDSAGNILWAIAAGGTSNDAGYGVSTDINNNVWITGNFASPSISFGSTTLNDTNFIHDFFLARLDNATGISSQFSQDGIVVFPNPSSGHFYINCENDIEVVTIRDLTGHVIYDAKPNSRIFSVNLETPGAYFMYFKSGKQTVVKKLIVCR